MSWKDVFNSDLKPTLWGNIQNANDVAKYSGYKYLAWNGWVYEVDGKRLDILSVDLV
jgi:hypothetical protein